MVSFQANTLSPKSTNTNPEVDNLSKKRKWEDSADDIQTTSDKKTKPDLAAKPFFNIDLQLETPLPVEWERCLDIQSGEIHFYNSRTNKRTSSEPSKNVDLSTQDHHHMSLDLELNLPCDSTRKNQTRSRHLTDLSIDVNRNRKASEIARSPSWLAFEGDQDQEMVATACMKCHMLVMLCKSSPTCPNCKFMHPPDQSSPKLFKQRLSLLC